jgi:uncharacterized protein
MTRPKCCRKISTLPNVWQYHPEGESTDLTEEIILSLDELESVRLADFNGLYQEQAAEKMGVSRQTFGRIIEKAHKKIADSILHGKALKIEGGNISVNNPIMRKCKKCNELSEQKCDTMGKRECPRCHKLIKEK